MEARWDQAPREATRTRLSMAATLARPLRDARIFENWCEKRVSCSSRWSDLVTCVADHQAAMGNAANLAVETKERVQGGGDARVEAGIGRPNRFSSFASAQHAMQLLRLAHRSASGFFFPLAANSTSRLIASARDGRSVCRRRQSSTIRKNCSDTRI